MKEAASQDSKQILQDMLEQMIDAIVALRALNSAAPARSVTIMLLEDHGFTLLANQAFIMEGAPGDVLKDAVAAISRRPCWRAAKPHLGSHALMAERDETHLSNHERAALLPVAVSLLEEGKT